MKLCVTFHSRSLIKTSTHQAMQKQAFIMIYEQCSELDTTPSVSQHNQACAHIPTTKRVKSLYNIIRQ